MVTDPWGAADASVLDLEVTAGAGDVPTGAVDATGLPVPVGVAELATGGAAEVGYSLADEDELDDGAAAESGAALLEVSGLAVDEGVGPGTSTWTFGGAPSGCGITMIGPTRTGPTCIGPTVTGAGGSSVAPGGVVELTGGAVFELGVEFVRRGVWVLVVPAGGATSGREAVAEGASVRWEVARCFGAAGGWIGSTVPGAADEVRCRGGWRLALVAPAALDSGRLAGVFSSSRGGGDEDDGPLLASELCGVLEGG